MSDKSAVRIVMDELEAYIEERRWDETHNGGSVAAYDQEIKSLDFDGFTVDDTGADNHPNKLGETYTYIAWGQE